MHVACAVRHAVLEGVKGNRDREEKRFSGLDLDREVSDGLFNLDFSACLQLCGFVVEHFCVWVVCVCPCVCAGLLW